MLLSSLPFSSHFEPFYVLLISLIFISRIRSQDPAMILTWSLKFWEN